MSFKVFSMELRETTPLCKWCLLFLHCLLFLSTSHFFKWFELLVSLWYFHFLLCYVRAKSQWELSLFSALYLFFISNCFFTDFLIVSFLGSYCCEDYLDFSIFTVQIQLLIFMRQFDMCCCWGTKWECLRKQEGYCNKIVFIFLQAECKTPQVCLHNRRSSAFPPPTSPLLPLVLLFTN